LIYSKNTGTSKILCHPEASFFEAVRISSDTEGVILRLHFSKPWGSPSFRFFF